MCFLQFTKKGARIPLPTWTGIPPIIAPLWWRSHDFIPRCPVDTIRVCLYLCNRRIPICTIIIDWFPAWHSAIETIGVDAQVLKVGDIEATTSLYRTNVTA